MLVLASVGGACSDTSGEDDEGSGATEGEDESGAEGAEGMDTTSEETETTAAEETGGALCEETPAQTAGPFPQAGLERSNLDLYGHSGITLTLSGRVLNADCEPVAGAQVLMWHATPSPPGVVPATPQSDPDYDSAVYDHANQAGQATPDGQAVPTGEQMYYGWVTTDDEGRWEFTTLRPGWYLNGGTYRPAHLHFRVYLGADELLTTQLYFPDDPFNELDGIQVNACNNELCYVEYQDEDGAVATFDLHVLS